MKNPDQPIEVTAKDMRDFFVHHNTGFTTSQTGAAVQVESHEDDRGMMLITIAAMYMARKDIKELRAFLKCLLADMKSEEA